MKWRVQVTITQKFETAVEAASSDDAQTLAVAQMSDEATDKLMTIDIERIGG